MSTMPPYEPSPDFIDPRLLSGFQAEHWPLCDGEAAPLPNPPGLHERRCLEFLTAFYRLNVLNGQRLSSRTGSCSDEFERTLLAQIADATTRLEELEDRYAPIGFFGEPLMVGICCQSVGFVRPEKPRLFPTASELTAQFDIPGLEEIPNSELHGPARVVHFSHGKVDL